MKPLYFLIAGLLPTTASAQDALNFSDMTDAAGSAFLWPVELSGSAAVVGVQFDIVYPAGQLTLGTALPGAETPDVIAAAREISPGRARVAVSSLRNVPLVKDTITQLPLSLPAGGPGGGPSFTIEHIILALADGTTVPSAARYGPITEWRKRHFTPEELLQGSLVGDEADPEGDGVPNLLEYAVGGNPRLSLPGEHPFVGFNVIFDNGQRKLYLALNYRQALDAPGIILEPEVSKDLARWTVGGAPIQTGTGDANSVPMQVRVLAEGEAKKFLRLKISRQPQ